MSARAIIKLRRDASNIWQSINPTLSLGEPGFETDTKRLKIGDGTSSWNDLDYVAGSGGGAAVVEEDIEDTVAALMVSGTGVKLTYNDGADTLTVNSIPYSAGTGINISSYTINSSLTGGTGIQINGSTINVTGVTLGTLVGGTGIQVSNNTIQITGVPFIAGTNIQIVGNTISSTGTGGSSGTFQSTYSGSISGTINDWDPIVTANTVRVTGSNGIITGLISTYQTATLFINVGSSSITLKHENTSSTAGNRFRIPWAGDYTISASGGGALIIRDETDSRWRVV